MPRSTRVRAHQRRNGTKVREHQRRIKSDERDELVKPLVYGVVAVTAIDAASQVMRE